MWSFLEATTQVRLPFTKASMPLHLFIFRNRIDIFYDIVSWIFAIFTDQSLLFLESVFQNRYGFSCFLLSSYIFFDHVFPPVLNHRSSSFRILVYFYSTLFLFDEFQLKFLFIWFVLDIITAANLILKKDAIARFMFNMAFENSIEDGYVTEKPFDALMAGKLS